MLSDHQGRPACAIKLGPFDDVDLNLWSIVCITVIVLIIVPADNKLNVTRNPAKEVKNCFRYIHTRARAHTHPHTWSKCIKLFNFCERATELALVAILHYITLNIYIALITERTQAHYNT